MTQKTLNEAYQEMIKAHEETTAIFVTKSVPEELKREYKNKLLQYDSMYQALENMKKGRENEDAVNGLVIQQVAILNKLIDFEKDILARIQKM